jgi:predicted cupin superfamily sugar epimerase
MAVTPDGQRPTDSDARVAALIARLGLKPLPVEGTLFARTWVSAETLPDGTPAGTSIVGLHAAVPLSRSLFHRLDRDEVWHFHAGDPIRLVLLAPDGGDRDIVLGPDPLAGHAVQVVVPAGTWQAGELAAGGRWALFGCTVAPGFTAGCFTPGRRTALMRSHPGRAADIERLGCDDDATGMSPGSEG